MIDRDKFFPAIKPLFGRFEQRQVDGVNAVLDAWEKRYHKDTSVPQFAVCLATDYHETAHTMQPIKEYGDRARFMRLYDVTGQNPTRARQYGNTEVGDGAKYCGRGLVQLTWKVNYQKATKELRRLNVIGPEVDFVRDPDLVMQMQYAIPIMFTGMEEGWFTGRSLDQIVDNRVDGNEQAQFTASRVIINGKDRAEQIAGNGMVFLRALVASVDPKAPVKAPEIVAALPVNTGIVGASFWNRFWSAAADLTSKGA